MPFGYGDTQFINFPIGQEDSRVREMQNRLGISVLEFVRRTDAAIAALNDTDSLISMLTYDTTQLSIRQGGTSDKVWQRSAEYTPGRPQRGGPGRSWMLPIHFNEIALGFTERALQHMQVEQFEDELRTTVQAVAKGRRADVLERLFNHEVLPLDDDGTGTTPGFAGSGTGNDAFIGILPSGVATSGSYTHYFQAADNGTAIDTAIKLMQTNLELWNSGPFDLLPGPDAFDRITSNIADTTQFVSAGSDLIRRGEAQDVALVDPNRYAGVYNGRIRVLYPDYQIAGNGFAIVKTFGAGSQQNPLAWRYDPLYGRRAYVEDRALFPLAEAMIMQTYGVGVGNRVAATLCSIGGSAGVYAPPAINR